MKDSSLGRLLGVLLKPGETFRAIAERPTWLLPMIVLILLGGGAQWLLQSRADPEEVIRAQMQAYGMTLTTEQMDKAVEQSQDPARRNIGLIVGLLVAIALNFIFAALLWMGFRLFGSEIEYLPALSTAMYGLVPLAVAALLNVLLILVRGSVSVEEVTAGGVLMSNLGFLASDDTPVPLRGLLQSVDFFSIWTIALLVIGFQTTARTSKGTAAGVVLTVWLLGVGLKIGLMSLPLLLKGGS